MRTKGEQFLRNLEKYLSQRLSKFAASKGESLKYLGKLDVAFIELDFDRHKLLKILAKRGQAIKDGEK